MRSASATSARLRGREHDAALERRDDAAAPRRARARRPRRRALRPRGRRAGAAPSRCPRPRARRGSRRPRARAGGAPSASASPTTGSNAVAATRGVSGPSGVDSTDTAPAPVCASRRSNASDRRGRSRSSTPRPRCRRASPPATPPRRAAPGRGRACAWARRAAPSAVVGEQVGEQVLAVGEPRQPRLHAVEQLALGEPLPLLAAPRLLRDERGGALAHLVGRQQLARREDARLVDVVGRALVGDRERRRGGRPRRPTGRCARGGRRSTGTRRRSSRAPRPRRAPRPGTRAGSPPATRRATSSSRSTWSPGRTTHRLDVLDVRAEPLHQRAHRRHDDRRAVRRRRRGGATSPAGAGPWSRATATPARTAASPTPGRARPRPRPRNCPRSCDEPLGLGAGRHRQQQRPPGASTPASAATNSARAASGTATIGLPADHRAQRRLLGEERRRGAASGGCGSDRRARRPCRLREPGCADPVMRSVTPRRRQE